MKHILTRGGKWITALSPIINDNGEMIAMFGIDISIESIASFQKENATHATFDAHHYYAIVFSFYEKRIYKSIGSC